MRKTSLATKNRGKYGKTMEEINFVMTVELKIITRQHVNFRIKETKMPLRCIRIPTREQLVIIVGQVKSAHKR